MRMRFAVAALLSCAFAWTAPAHAHDDDIELFLRNAGPDPDARARARFDDDDDGQRFKIDVEALHPGMYSVLVGGVSVGTFAVESDGDGRLRLEGSPLGFDPRGKVIEIESEPAGVVFFRATFPTSREKARARIKVKESFADVGPDPDASGRAKLRAKHGKVRFQVKVEDLPVGTYDLLVGGGKVAEIPVTPEEDEPEGFEGKVKFDSHFAHGSIRMLTFDPLCQRLTIAQGTTVFLAIDEFGASKGLCSP